MRRWLSEAGDRQPCPLQPGLLPLPAWFDEADALRLAGLLADLHPAPLPVLALPWDRLQAADPLARRRARGLLVLRLPAGARPDPEVAPRATLLLLDHGGTPAHLGDHRDALLATLSSTLADEDHPLRLLGAGPWLAGQLAARASEPLDVLDLLDEAVAHRRGLDAQDEEAWARSVDHAAGRLVARRLERLGEGRWDALRAVLGLPCAPRGQADAEALSLLGPGRGGPRPSALARGLSSGEARGGLLQGLSGAPLPEDLRAVLVPPPAAPAPVAPSPGPSEAGDEGIARAARAWLGERAADPLLAEALAALDRASRDAHWSDAARLPALGPLRLRLQRAGGEVAEALDALLELTAAWLPADEAAQTEALARLERLHARGRLPDALWARALLRRAERLLNGPVVEDRRAEAGRLLDAVVSLGPEGEGEATWLYLTGRLHQLDGEADAARAAFTRAEEAFRALGSERDVVRMASQRAALDVDAGRLDEALRFLEEVELPFYARAGDARRVARVRYSVAELQAALGHPEEALEGLQDAATALEAQGDRRGAALARARVAEVQLQLGQAEAARELLEAEALPVLEGLGDLRQGARASISLARALDALGQHEEARQLEGRSRLTLDALTPKR